MAANATQAVGVSTIYRGGSILLFLVTAVLLGISVATFRKCKPLENAEN